MSSYRSNFDDGDEIGEYNWTPYGYSYESYDYGYSSQASSPYSKFNEPSVISPEIDYSTYSFTDPKLLEYYPSTYENSCDPSVFRSGINYSVYSVSEPRFIEYEPNFNGSAYFSSQIQHRISYSEVVLNDLDYEEYDPTPFGGGYDLIATYGKPLPPSDEICYPRSTPESNVLTLDGFSYGSIPSPYGKDDPSLESRKKSKDANVAEEPKESNGSKVSNASEEGKVLLSGNDGDEKEGYTFEDDYGSTGLDRDGNGVNGGYGYEYGNQMTPYGSGLEAMDICESIFGYWPCLYRKDQTSNGNCQENCGGRRDCNPWDKAAADYLFGSTYEYGEQRYGEGYHGNSINSGEWLFQQ